MYSDETLIDELLDIAELEDIDHNICEVAWQAAIRLQQLAHDTESRGVVVP